MWQSLLYVVIGSSIGGASRYLIARMLPYTTFPFSTLAVNTIGCLLIGLFWGFTQRLGWKSELWLLLVTGFCGSFTTFSTFILDNVKLLQDGHTLQVIAYLFISLMLGFIALYIGQALTR